MTAEVAILNTGGIALAADSAVTIGDGLKIYNSESKLFALSKYCPVGIMFYNDANLMGIPLETLVKIYRKKLGKTKKNKLIDYVVDFIEFVRDPANLFNQDMQKAYFRQAPTRYFYGIRREIESLISRFASPPLDPRIKWDVSTLQLVEFFINWYHESWSQAPFLSPWNDYEFQEMVWEFQDDFDDCGQKMFGTQNFSPATQNQMREIAASLFTKNRSNDWYFSGIAIAGYGEDEFFPSIESFQVEGMLKDRLRLFRKESRSISPEKKSEWLAFAQSDMVESFMKGIAPGLKTALQTSLTKLFGDIPNLFAAEVDCLSTQEQEDLAKKLKPVSSDALLEFFREIELRIKTHYLGPVEETIAFLPKDELAEMAENLIGLTSFKRKVTLGQETVGGPVDVAVISKGDGFVWIKRKNYFDPEKNRIFSANYFND